MLRSHLPPSRQNNKWDSQCKHKKCKNKHSTNSWRHKINPKHKKKFSRKGRQHDNYRYDIDDELHDCGYPDYGRPEFWRSNMDPAHKKKQKKNEYHRQRRYKKKMHILRKFIWQTCLIDFDKNLQFLVNKQLENYAENGDGMFLDCKNWSIYSLTTESRKRMPRGLLCRFKFDENYYDRLSDSYYWDMDSWYSDISVETNLRKVKDIHCQIILDRIYAYGEQQMYATLDTLYESVKDFPGDIFWEIIDYMGQFPQTGPTPVDKIYDYYRNVADSEDHYYWKDILNHDFIVSRTGLRYDALDMDWEFNDDDDEIDVDFADFEEDDMNECRFRITEVYHLRSHFSLPHTVNIVAKIEPQSFYIYMKLKEYGYSDYFASEYWMDVWDKIELDCIKVDCYNNTKLPEMNNE